MARIGIRAIGVGRGEFIRGMPILGQENFLQMHTLSLRSLEGLAIILLFKQLRSPDSEHEYSFYQDRFVVDEACLTQTNRNNGERKSTESPATFRITVPVFCFLFGLLSGASFTAKLSFESVVFDRPEKSRVYFKKSDHRDRANCHQYDHTAKCPGAAHRVVNGNGP
jgi:hypothetical protein